MNIHQTIERAKVDFLADVITHLIVTLNTLHACAGARFKDEIPGNWTYGNLRNDQGSYNCRVWQQSSRGVGNLHVMITFEPNSLHPRVRVTNDNQTWVDGLFPSEVDSTQIANWIADMWDVVVCEKYDAAPLPENRRYYPAKIATT